MGRMIDISQKKLLHRVSQKHNRFFLNTGSMSKVKFDPTCWVLVQAHFEPLKSTSPAWRWKLDSKLQQVSLFSLGVSQKEIKEVLSQGSSKQARGTRGL